MKCIVCARRESGIRYGCPDCVNRVTRQLNGIGEYWTTLPELVEPTRRGGGRGAPGYGSRTPANDDILTALDPRSRPGGEPTTLCPDRPTSWVRSLPFTVNSLASAIADERGHTGQPFARGIWYLIDSVQFMAEQHWFDDFADDIGELHRQCRSLAHDEPSGPLGACLTVDCDGLVRWRRTWRGKQRVSVAVCDQCDREYDGLELVRLGAAQELAA